MKDNPTFIFEPNGSVSCADCPYDNGVLTMMTDLCQLNDCPTRENYADSVALANGEPHH